MIIDSNDLIVLDTSAVIHLVRDDATGREILRRFELRGRDEKPLISSITRGEIGAFAKWRKWGDRRLIRLQQILDEFVTVSAGLPDVINSYSEIKALSLSKGNPMSQNDTWIAATCVAVGAQLITNDKDFDWIHPDTLVRHYVQPA